MSDPEYDVDRLMERVQAEARSRSGSAKGARSTVRAASSQGWAALDRELARAQETQNVGGALPPMSRLTGLRRLAAMQLAKGFLRLAQLITRDQRDFNQAMVEVSRQLAARARETSGRLEELEARMLALEARSAAPEARREPLR